MSAHTISRKTYEKLLEAFRAQPSNVSNAARHAGCHRATARKALREGWPDAGWHPIVEVLERDRVEARAALAEQAKLERERVVEQRRQEQVDVLATKDAGESRAREVLLVRASRENVLGYQAGVNDLLHGQRKLAAMIRAQLEQAEKDNKPLPVREGVRLMATIGAALRQGNEAAILAMRMERLLVGEPEALLGVSDMTGRQAVAEVGKAQRALQRAAAKGYITVPEEGELAGNLEAMEPEGSA